MCFQTPQIFLLLYALMHFIMEIMHFQTKVVSEKEVAIRRQERT